jgi:hypothetical protein
MTGSFLRERTAAGGHAPLRAQERRLFIDIEVEQAGVVEFFARLDGRRVQLLLQDGGTHFPRHQSGSVVERNR